MRKHLLCVLTACLVAGRAVAGELGVNLFGLSYHFEHRRAAEIDADNGFNPGVGLRYRVPRHRMDWLLDASVYRDSGRRRAVYAGGAAVWKPLPRLGVGLALIAAQSDTYNEGEPFVTPLPLVIFDIRGVSVNFTYIPRIGGVNEINTLAVWLTLWPSRW